MFFKRASASSNSIPAEVHAMVARGDVRLVDVREPSRAPGGADRRRGVHAAVALRPRGAAGRCERSVVFHCLSGRRSATAAMQCQRAGIAEVRNMRGGIAAWKAAGLPTRRG